MVNKPAAPPPYQGCLGLRLGAGRAMLGDPGRCESYRGGANPIGEIWDENRKTLILYVFFQCFELGAMMLPRFLKVFSETPWIYLGFPMLFAYLFAPAALFGTEGEKVQILLGLIRTFTFGFGRVRCEILSGLILTFTSGAVRNPIGGGVLTTPPG